MRTLTACLLAGALGLQPAPLAAQEADLSTLRQAASSLQGSPGLAANPLPGPGDGLALAAPTAAELQYRYQQEAKAEAEIQALKARDKGPVRFASDLFARRDPGRFQTDGGISEDYVLGTGDRLNLNVVGGATFAVPLEVDGRGRVVIPKVGSAQVGGLSLGQARQAVQALVARNFSRSQADLQVVRLREVRISVLGEVYKPGSYLVPSLGSLVNVLSLSGGPTSAGSYRDIRVIRGGKVVFRLDLYPLRAEGLGNPNFALQSGDMVFVPLADQPLVLRGAFTRVVQAAELKAAPGDGPQPAETLRRASIQREITSIQAQLGPAPPPAPALDPARRQALEARLLALNAELARLDRPAEADRRLPVDPLTHLPLLRQDPDLPDWLRRWREEGVAPEMAFELRAGETLADAERFAGGRMPEAGASPVTVRRRDAEGRIGAFTVAESGAGAFPLQRGDEVEALPQREVVDRVVEVAGWARLPGAFARTEGLKVGDLLKRDGQVLPDTYRPRGEIIRTLPDGTTRYLAFNVDRALAGAAADDLPLQDRDRVELYRVEDFRLPKLLRVEGPVAFPGTFAFHEGMRAADLIFRAGVLQKQADGLEAQLARTRDGAPSEVIRLDLSRLASTDAGSPVGLTDDAVNPLLRPDDLLSFFEKPGYRVHRTVTLSGMVAHPGTYALDQDHETLGQLLAKAGGFAPDAMPEAGIFLRPLGQGADPIPALQGLDANQASDPGSSGINDILSRLNETKRSLAGPLLPTPLLHGLRAGDLNRLVVDFPAILAGDRRADVELHDGDQILIPCRSDTAYVVGEAASPFAAYKVEKGLTVRELLRLAGGTTRNADTWNIRLLKADGRIIDSWVMRKRVEPGDAVLVPQRIRRDSSWQENLAALTPLAILIHTLK
jgi:protein involved in polysaccharide export with SLBB domain